MSTAPSSFPMRADRRDFLRGRAATGPFQPSLDSLVDGYLAPGWFCDANFGVWAHWSA